MSESSAESFDAYRKWLGIPPAEQPPEHYRLLGIVRFEDDPDTISNAADRQMAHVRTFQTGPHSALSQKLLNEIAGARICLLNATKKAEYDNQLRAKDASQALPAARAPSSLKPAPPAARISLTDDARPQSQAEAAPQTPALRPQWPQVEPPAASSAPIRVVPTARRRRPKITLPASTPEPSDAHKTLLIVAGLAAICLAIFVTYKTRSGHRGKVMDEQSVSANQLVKDDADKAREIADSQEASKDAFVPRPVVITSDDTRADAPRPGQQPAVKSEDKPTANSVSVWLKLTRQLNDIGSWRVLSGQWSEKDGRIYGQGDARLRFQEELPVAFLLSFEMTVMDGMRPRIFFGDEKFHVGNEGYDRRLFLHGSVSPPVAGAPRPYETGVPLKLACRVTEHELEFLVDDKLVGHCGRQQSGPLALTISAGDWWSKGRVIFGSFTLAPAPPEPFAQPGTSTAAKDSEWRDLFDGKSLDGWTGDVGLMRVQNGVLVNNGKRAIVMAPGDYQDFEFEIEFRLARGGNSGLGICYSGSGDPSQNGLEVQMLDDFSNRRIQDIQRCGALYGIVGAKPGHFKRWPEWNRLRVTSTQDAVQVELNGSLVTDAPRSLMKQVSPQHPGALRTSGKVCLFPMEGRSEYRHLRIRERELSP